MSDRVASVVGSRKCEIQRRGCWSSSDATRRCIGQRLARPPGSCYTRTCCAPARDTGNPIEGPTSETLASLTGASRLDNPANPPSTAEAARNSKSSKDPCPALELPRRV